MLRIFTIAILISVNDIDGFGHDLLVYWLTLTNVSRYISYHGDSLSGALKVGLALLALVEICKTHSR